MDTLSRHLDAIAHFLEQEEATGHCVFPPRRDIFRALDLTPFDAVRVVILGQDPYHGTGQAHGLAFSVPRGVLAPPSLSNILKECLADVGAARPSPRDCDLSPWARQGVLLLNTLLTVRKDSPMSHAAIGWEEVCDSILEALKARPQPMVFLLWGAQAAARGRLLEGTQHILFKAPHPSPLSAHRGFFGARPFSKANEALTRLGHPAIDWSLSISRGHEATSASLFNDPLPN
jgi:uracil-DNA glycosylase